MKINQKELTDEDIHGIFRRFIDEVTKTSEEAEDKETRGGRTTDLKIYILDASPDIINNLDDLIDKLVAKGEIREHSKNFFNKHVIEVNGMNEGVWWLEIHTPRYERTDEFVLVEHDLGIWALTTERKDWAEDTIEKLVKYAPWMERIYLSSEDLEEIMGEISTSEFSGFTAKYNTPHRKRNATLRFHGAEPDDLEKAEETFGATPTRIEFDQENSPTTAIQGSGSNKGLITAESIREGSENKATETFLEVTDEFTEIDSDNFKIQTDSSSKFFDGGLVVDEFSTIELFDPERSQAEYLSEELEEEILSKQQYRYGSWGEDVYFVYDKYHEEVFEVGIESPDIAVHARENTSALSIRAFCENVIESFDSTYSIRKKVTKGGNT